MKIHIDENIPLLAEILSDKFDVNEYNAKMLNSAHLKNTDILFVRSTIQVNMELLHNTPVKLVATATSGSNHIDKDYLRNNNIIFGDAKGSNANSVAEYVIYSILKRMIADNLIPQTKTIGIIGYGNIGKIVAKYSKYLGMKVFVNDAPLYEEGYEFPEFIGHKEYEDLFASCDVITNHIPLTYEGKHKTYGLINNKLLKLMKQDSLFIHTSRGGIVSENDLLNVAEEKNVSFAIDVWGKEPVVNQSLLRLAMLATPHIAGYSYEGKLRGVKMLIDLLRDFLGYDFKTNLLDSKLSAYKPLDKKLFNDYGLIYNILAKNRNLEYDHQATLSHYGAPPQQWANFFGQHRKNYPVRRESL